MIGFGCAVHSEEKYARFALPGIERVRDPGAPLIELRGRGCLFRAYNELLDRARADRRIEALALIHEDTEIRDDRFEDRVRWAFADPAVAIVGTIGSVGVQGIDLVGARLRGGLLDPRADRRSGAVRDPLIGGSEMSGSGSSGEVDMVDGYLLILSRWAINELRFDERDVGPGFHGYDADICFQARGGAARCSPPVAVAHHRNSVSPTPYRDDWMRAQIAFRRKWEARGMLKRPSLPFPPYRKTKQERELERRAGAPEPRPVRSPPQSQLSGAALRGPDRRPLAEACGTTAQHAPQHAGRCSSSWTRLRRRRWASRAATNSQCFAEPSASARRARSPSGDREPVLTQVPEVGQRRHRAHRGGSA